MATLFSRQAFLHFCIFYWKTQTQKFRRVALNCPCSAKPILHIVWFINLCVSVCGAYSGYFLVLDQPTAHGYAALWSPHPYPAFTFTFFSSNKSYATYKMDIISLYFLQTLLNCRETNHFLYFVFGIPVFIIVHSHSYWYLMLRPLRCAAASCDGRDGNAQVQVFRFHFHPLLDIHWFTRITDVGRVDVCIAIIMLLCCRVGFLVV